MLNKLPSNALVRYKNTYAADINENKSTFEYNIHLKPLFKDKYCFSLNHTCPL